MKIIATTIIVFLLSHMVYAQVINPGLDQWDEPDPMKPFEHIVGWETLNRISYGALNLSVTRKEEGQRVFARVESKHAGQDTTNPGYLFQRIASDNLKSISYTSRCDSLAGLGLCLVHIVDGERNILFADTIRVESDSFEVRTVDFSSNILTDAIGITFTANGRSDYTEPEFDGYAVFDIDDVRADFISSVDRQILENDVLEIYPNPSSGVYHLDLDDSLEANSIEVHNFQGQLIWSGQYSRTIDLTHLSSGNYIISIKTEQGVVSKRISVGK